MVVYIVIETIDERENKGDGEKEKNKTQGWHGQLEKHKQRMPANGNRVSVENKEINGEQGD